MPQVDPTTVQKMGDAIKLVDSDHIVELPFELFDKQTNKTTQLIAESGKSAPIEGRHRWFEYKFIDPALISEIAVSTNGYTEFHEFEFKWQDANGNERSLSLKPVNNTFRATINGICRKVSFRPPSAFFSDPSIISVRVYGLPDGAISDALDVLSDLESYKSKIIGITDAAVADAGRKTLAANAAESNHAAIDREIQALKSTVSRTKKVIDDLSDKRNQLITENSAAEDTLRSNKARISDLDAKSLALTDNQSNLITNIQKSTLELKGLRENINLFPSEIVGFVNQGSKNIFQYTLIAGLPILVIVVMFILLVRGSADLSIIISENPKINIQAIMLSRLPYVAIAVARVTASYKIARVFISEIININNQRLSLTKLSIIAKDISNAAEFDRNINDEDIYRLRTDLKMQLLRDHLKDYISKDFKIELPRRLLGVVPFGTEKVSAKLADPGKDSLETV
ncbi:hypothetical protein [uncultured Sphingomonas sp.]|uniref:hypothetical protein n=1 Tax=uncultured Sphingomonas sp. TaxID=158754 RepID=UPI0035CA5E1C